MKENGKSSTKVIAQTEYFDVHVMRPSRYGENPWPCSVGQHAKVMLDPRATFVLQCIERWAMVAGEPNGEDSAGRQRLRRLTPSEIVDHATKCAAAAFAAFEEQGWAVKVPAFEDIADALKDQENGN
jgi:hypothetical protein